MTAKYALVIEYQVLRGNEWVTPCGSSHTWILQGIKTVRGALNRMKQSVKPPKDTQRIIIRTYYDWGSRKKSNPLYIEMVNPLEEK